MNDLCSEVGYSSINHGGEQLCGDHVDVVTQEDGSRVIVLADGLGSGVQASILSTLTSKLLSTMVGAGLSLEECVETIIAALPKRSDHGVAYSTFTVIHLIGNHTAEIMQYDNPMVIMLRDMQQTDYPITDVTIGDKVIKKSVIRLKEDDTFIIMSDGCPYASANETYNYDWKWEDIAAYMEVMNQCGFTAKTLAAMLIEECAKLYGESPRDDATAVVVKIRKRVPVNLLFGPPSDRDDEDRMMNLFFAKKGKRIACGGTTANVVAHWLHKPVVPSGQGMTDNVPPTSSIEGMDLVTEGILTLQKVAEYAADFIGENQLYNEWITHQNGATQICRMLFEEGTDINFFVGKAVNPAHQSADMPISFARKMTLVKELAEYLEKMGKQVTINYF